MMEEALALWKHRSIPRVEFGAASTHKLRHGRRHEQKRRGHPRYVARRLGETGDVGVMQTHYYPLSHVHIRGASTHGLSFVMVDSAQWSARSRTFRRSARTATSE